MPVVSISNDQRTALPEANWQATVYHGLPRTLYEARLDAGAYLAFIGRISPEKRLDRAIAIARAAGWPLRVAAKVDKADETYMRETIAPLLDEPGVEFLGEIGEEEKNDFLGGAAALLFPIDWAEPFGLVMIEAMACGTPVVAWRRGSVAEVIDDGVSGFVVESLDDAVAAVRRIPSLDRRACRAAFDARFSSARMAADYVAIYERLVAAAPAMAST
jgi:glycosyltransferase involved in cell wall biosynthesis